MAQFVGLYDLFSRRCESSDKTTAEVLGMEKEHEERWLPVVGHEGWYEVSDWGNIKRVKGAAWTFVGRPLKSHLDSWGYRRAGICENGKMYTVKVHRVVAAAFIGPCPKDKQVNHKNGDKANNHVENLEYMTQSENNHHAYDTGLKHALYGEDVSGSKLTEENVHEIRKMLADDTIGGDPGERGYLKRKVEMISKRFNVSDKAIYSIYYGTNWSYLKEEEDDERT